MGEKPYKKKFIYKDFDLCHPPVYNGDTNPIVCTRWVSEIEGAFRTSQCPQDLKVVFAVSMLRDRAKRWWDGLLAINGKATLEHVEWREFKTMFYKEFRSEAEAQFCLEFLENDQLLKEQFYLKLRKSLREKISLRQMESFSMLVDVARNHEIEQSRVGESDLKRKYDGDKLPNKRFKQDGGSGSNPARRNVPFCKNCRRIHTGPCRSTEKGCYSCGKPGHMSRDCKASHKPIMCFKCFEEGHMRSLCPKLTEEKRQEEKRK
uniref:uncharacterized protein LOC122609086 n=1 Tax=Erigeron canadensis TaxID=72917 RepID=UPI001CB91065|nr:uncharacterized protein LOC122609086 [Erigeron canadensis]